MRILSHIIIVLLFTQFLSAKAPVVFVIPAGEEGILRLQQWQPLVDYLKNISGLTINIEIVKDHKTVQQGLEKKTYDVSFINPVWYVLFKKKDICIPLARAVIHDQDFYRSILIVRNDSIYRFLSDLKGHTIALTMPYESDEGYYIPLALLHKEGREILESQNFIYTDTFLSILKGVVYRSLDAGFISSDVLMDPNNIELQKQARIILKSDPIPQWAVIARKDLQESTVQILIHSFLYAHNLKTGEKALAQAGFNKFIPVKDEDYQIVKEYMDSLGEDFAPSK